MLQSVSIGAAAALTFSAPAQAHGLSGRADLPIPIELFVVGAALVLIVSFLGLAALWPRPQLERDRFMPLPEAFSRVFTSRVVDVVCATIGAATLVLLVVAGFAGSDVVSANIAPTFIYVVFWLGLVPASLLFGDVFRALNPWRAVGRFVGWLLRGGAPEPLPYPERLGRWPAAAGLLAFAWLELVSSTGDRPGSLAVATVVYSAATWLGMALYGVEAWTARGEAFGVYFNLYSRLSVFERRGRVIGLRPPLSGLARLEPASGTVAVLAVMIGSVSFDGLSSGPSWQRWLRPVLDFLRDDVGMGPEQALELTFAAGLLAAVGFVYGFYRLGIEGAHSLDRRMPARRLARSFAASLVPIALAYASAHYVSLLVFQSQALPGLASDPLGRGWDLLGAAGTSIDYTIVSAEAFWYLQLAFVLVGHLAALVLAHDKALVLYDDPRSATRSQYAMLTVMVGFTMLALWLLSEASKG